MGLLEETIAVASADAILLHVFADELYVDGAPAVVGVRLRVVAEGVEMGEVIADGGEGLTLITPALGEVGFAAGGSAHAIEDGSGDGIFLGFAGADHVDDGAG